MENQGVSEKLKAIRERSGLSIRALADRLGVPTSTYANYEIRYKRPFLPMNFAMDLAVAYRGTGISEAEVLVLAGVPAPERVENGHPPPSTVSD